jgi:hypothetical protein
VFPVSEKQVPVTNPTYPVPTTAIFIFRGFRFCGRKNNL